jgi:hypothetical protein
VGDVTAPASSQFAHDRTSPNPQGLVTTQQLARDLAWSACHASGPVICPVSGSMSRMHLLASVPRTVTHGGA